MIGLALEGGGAKGAFHMGAVKALYEEGWAFNGVAGTSIGAFNGAIIAQGDFEKGYELWETMDLSDIFDIEETQINKLLSKTIDRESIAILSNLVKEIIENRGVDTVRMRKMLEENISEEKLRSSSMDFGLVTVSVTDLKPVELFKEEIPMGLMTSYIMASANFPIFKLEPLEGKLYVDGGFYDNCPINLLIRKGYEKIVAIRTLGIGLNRKIENTEAEILNILPSEDLGRVLYFDKALIMKNLKIGYFDTMRVLRNLSGKRYYITEAFEEEEVFKKLSNLRPECIDYINEPISIQGYSGRRALLEKTVPKLAELLNMSEEATYSDILLGLLEYLAEEYQIDRLCFFTAKELLGAVKKSIEEHMEFDSFDDTYEGKKTMGAMVKERVSSAVVKPMIDSIARRMEGIPIFSKEQMLKKTSLRIIEVLDLKIEAL